MTISRRSFLAGILSSRFAPAVVGSGVLMPVRALARVPFPLNGLWEPTDEGVLRIVSPIALLGLKPTKIFIPIGRFGDRSRWVDFHKTPFDITEASLERLLKETLK